MQLLELLREVQHVLHFSYASLSSLQTGILLLASLFVQGAFLQVVMIPGIDEVTAKHRVAFGESLD